MNRKRIAIITIISIELIVIASLFKGYSSGESLENIKGRVISNFDDSSGCGITEGDVNRHLPSKEELPEHPINFTQPSNNSILAWELKPNFTQLFDGYRVKIPASKIKINSDGFRDSEYSIEKPNNTYQIASLGDSVTFGWGVNNSDVWTEVLERKLNNASVEKLYQVLNFGIWGYNTRQEVELFEEKVQDYDPDLVLIQFHKNDAQNNTRIRELKEIYLKRIKNSTNLSEILVEIRGIRKAISQERRERSDRPDEKFMSNVLNPLERLRNLTKLKGTEVVLFGWPIEEEQEKVLRNLTDSYGWRYVDIESQVGKNYDLERLSIPKDPHPNSLGHKAIAKKLLRSLNFSSM